MDVMVVGDFAVKDGRENEFESAFARERDASEPRPAVKQVYFGRSMSLPGRYRRVGIWPSRDAWREFQAGEGQRRFWSELREHLCEEPRFEFYSLVA